MHADREKTLNLLKTVRGQIDGLIKMVEDDRYCIDISNQILASISILKKVNLDILKGHFICCIKSAFLSGNDKESEKKIDEVINLLAKFSK